MSQWPYYRSEPLTFRIIRQLLSKEEYTKLLAELARRENDPQKEGILTLGEGIVNLLL